MSRTCSKDNILNAAEAVVIESGASHMTLDAVAERSGVSKGGLMYNFPSKESLLESMLGRMDERMVQLREKVRQELLPEGANELMVEIRTLQTMASSSDHRMGAALIAVAANQPELTRPLRDVWRKRFFNEVVSSGNVVRSAILLFAAMGLHFNELLHLSLLDDEQKQEIFEELLRLAGNEDEL